MTSCTDAVNAASVPGLDLVVAIAKVVAGADVGEVVVDISTLVGEAPGPHAGKNANIILISNPVSRRMTPLSTLCACRRDRAKDRYSTPRYSSHRVNRGINPAELPDEMAISAITLAELSAGLHEVRRNDKQDAYDEHVERARRLDVLQRAESEFDPVPFDAEAARIYGRVSAAVIASGRKPRRRMVDLMIAATAIAEDLPLFTTNSEDFKGLHDLLTVVPVTRPQAPHESS
jgi:predicted nucleic acid-binding protein